MDLNEKIKAAESRVFKAVFPNDTNHYDTMFGGKVMSMMDEIAFIAATRFCRKKVVGHWSNHDPAQLRRVGCIL